MNRTNSRMQAPRRRVAQTALVFMLVTAVPLGIYIYRDRPDLYNPTPVDLVEASRQLEIGQRDTEQLAEMNRESAEALKASLHWLHMAAATYPNDLAVIKAIAEGLKEWEDQARAGTMSARELQDRYRALEAKVQRLINNRSGIPRDG